MTRVEFGTIIPWHPDCKRTTEEVAYSIKTRVWIRRLREQGIEVQHEEFENNGRISRTYFKDFDSDEDAVIFKLTYSCLK